MSEDFKFIAVGKEEFALPFGAAGLEFAVKESLEEAVSFMEEQDTASSFFILDEDIVTDEDRISGLEAGGAAVLIIKAWGRSKMSRKKIREASIRALGMDILKDSE